MQSKSFFKMAIVLGLLSAIGPFAVDMYLPALPSIGTSLHADIGTVQMSLTSFFLALGTGQLLYGPLSDMYGRKPPLYVGLVLFTLASIGCALAKDMHMLILLRFLQGLGAAAGLAIPRAIVRDLHTGVDAARLMSLLMLVFSVSPILAPLVGSAVITFVGWRGVFWAVTLAAMIALVMMSRMLHETRPASERIHSSLTSGLSAYGRLLRDRHFLLLVFIGSFTMAGFFTFLANSSFVMIDHYGLSPTVYSVCFAANAVFFIGSAQFTAVLSKRFGMVRLVKMAFCGCTVATLTMLAYFASGGDNMWMLILPYFVASAFMGLVIPSTSVLALDQHGANAGTASALMGTLQMLTGAGMVAVVGVFTNGRPLPMVAGMAAGSFIALILASANLTTQSDQEH